MATAQRIRIGRSECFWSLKARPVMPLKPTRANKQKMIRGWWSG